MNLVWSQRFAARGCHMPHASLHEATLWTSYKVGTVWPASSYRTWSTNLESVHDFCIVFLGTIEPMSWVWIHATWSYESSAWDICYFWDRLQHISDHLSNSMPMCLRSLSYLLQCIYFYRDNEESRRPRLFAVAIHLCLQLCRQQLSFAYLIVRREDKRHLGLHLQGLASTHIGGMDQ